jgi:hypothetical protein
MQRSKEAPPCRRRRSLGAGTGAATPGHPPSLLPLRSSTDVSPCCAGSGSVAPSSQGLTLVRFLAQPEPFLTQNTPPTTPCYLLDTR